MLFIILQVNHISEKIYIRYINNGERKSRHSSHSLDEDETIVSGGEHDTCVVIEYESLDIIDPDITGEDILEATEQQQLTEADLAIAGTSGTPSLSATSRHTPPNTSQED